MTHTIKYATFTTSVKLQHFGAFDRLVKIHNCRYRSKVDVTHPTVYVTIDCTDEFLEQWFFYEKRYINSYSIKEIKPSWLKKLIRWFIVIWQELMLIKNV